jgi:hypothetical protein
MTRHENHQWTRNKLGRQATLAWNRRRYGLTLFGLTSWPNSAGSTQVFPVISYRKCGASKLFPGHPRYHFFSAVPSAMFGSRTSVLPSRQISPARLPCAVPPPLPRSVSHARPRCLIHSASSSGIFARPPLRFTPLTLSSLLDLTRALRYCVLHVRGYQPCGNRDLGLWWSFQCF